MQKMQQHPEQVQMKLDDFFNKKSVDEGPQACKILENLGMPWKRSTRDFHPVPSFFRSVAVFVQEISTAFVDSGSYSLFTCHSLFFTLYSSDFHTLWFQSPFHLHISHLPQCSFSFSRFFTHLGFQGSPESARAGAVTTLNLGGSGLDAGGYRVSGIEFGDRLGGSG